MKAKHFSLPASSDNLRLAVSAFEPDDLSKAVGIIQIVHGMVEHRKRYFALIQWLAEQGYICVIHDHRGHGESINEEIELGYMGRGGWKAMVEDVKIVGDWARKEYGAGARANAGAVKTLPYTLFGHSMGSMVVRSYAKRYDSTIDKLVVCGSPSDNKAKGFGRALAWILGTFGGWHSRPDLLQKISFKGYNSRFSPENQRYAKAWACSDVKVLEDVHNDPLCNFQFTANGFYNLYGLMADCYGGKWKVDKPELPVHFISGADDPCIHSEKDFRAAVDFIRSRGYSTVNAKLYPGMRHQILNEINKATVWADLLSIVKH